ncbi:MAG: S-layer homology domain-containing protein [Eggerthellaceae bacterium]|nr:S-layer homology domain-containing protein [Eggerthellaceae bacterium]
MTKATRINPTLKGCLAIGVTLAMTCGSIPLYAYADDVTDSYSDVVSGAWYVPYIQWVSDNGIMNGYDDGSGTFGVEQNLSRAQFAQILANWAGVDTDGVEDDTTGISDLENGNQWYTGACNWAYENGYIIGYDLPDGVVFDPDGNVTREQAVVILERWAAQNGMDTSFDQFALDGFSDAGDVSSWASEAMAWAVANGVLTGDLSGDDLLLNPGGEITRDQVSALIYRTAQLLPSNGETPDDPETNEPGANEPDTDAPDTDNPGSDEGDNSDENRPEAPGENGPGDGSFNPGNGEGTTPPSDGEMGPGNGSQGSGPEDGTNGPGSGSEGGTGAPGSGSGSDEADQGTSATTISTDGTYSNTTYTSTGDDENALRISDAVVTLQNITVIKSAGSSSNTENGDFYGTNAALLATDGAQVTITCSTVTSSVTNGNGIFSYGSGTVVNVSDTTITTTGNSSGGIQTTGGATTNATNLTVETSGSSSAAIRSDRGGGTVNIEGGTYTTNGYNSPSIYSTADITVTNATLTANGSEALVIEGNNSITLNDCTVSGNMSSTQGASSATNVHNVMIYQSMSGDANVGTATFSMTGGSLTSNNGDVFYITNPDCNMTLSGVDIINKSSGTYLFNVTGNTSSAGWGTAGANGGELNLTADGQTLEGDIRVDTISTMDLTLTNGSVLTGTINIEQNESNGAAVGNNAVVTLESGTTWNLTGDCSITSLTNNGGTINFNGHSITLADGTVLNG